MWEIWVDSVDMIFVAKIMPSTCAPRYTHDLAMAGSRWLKRGMAFFVALRAWSHLRIGQNIMGILVELSLVLGYVCWQDIKKQECYNVGCANVLTNGADPMVFHDWIGGYPVSSDQPGSELSQVSASCRMVYPVVLSNMAGRWCSYRNVHS